MLPAPIVHKPRIITHFPSSILFWSSKRSQSSSDWRRVKFNRLRALASDRDSDWITPRIPEPSPRPTKFRRQTLTLKARAPAHQGPILYCPNRALQDHHVMPLTPRSNNPLGFGGQEATPRVAGTRQVFLLSRGKASAKVKKSNCESEPLRRILPDTQGRGNSTGGPKRENPHWF